MAQEIGASPLLCCLAQTRNNQLPDAIAKQKVPRSNFAYKAGGTTELLKHSSKFTEVDDNVQRKNK